MEKEIVRMRKLLLILAFAGVSACVFAQNPDRKEVREGNRKFRKENFKEAEISYRKALVKDSSSFAGNYNLASSLYRQNDFESAGKYLDKLKESASSNVRAQDYYFNRGNVDLQKKDYAAAVEDFKQSLLKNPSDLEAKESYIYAKMMLQNQQNGGGQDQDQDQDQNQDQNKDQDQNQDQDKNQDQNQNQNKDQPQISPQQAQQLLQAIQAKEKDTQDKVKKEKAAALSSRQKDKNW